MIEAPVHPDRYRVFSLRHWFGPLAVLLLTSGLAACQSNGDKRADANAPPVVEVTATDYGVEAPDTIRSGWTTVQFRNRGTETHVVEFGRLPDDVSYRQYDRQLAFTDTVERQLATGAIDSAEAQAIYDRRLPDWFSSVQYTGGSGFLSPGETVKFTLSLTPGTYDVFCFIEDSTGLPHWALGMHRELTVRADSTGASPPKPDVELNLANYEITTDSRFRSGEQIVAVRFGQRPNSMETPIQDVHLVRLGPGVRVEDVEAWMTDYENPSPATFFGGALGMAAGNTVYLTLDPTLGRYAWVSQSSEAKGMRKTFTIE